MTATQTTDIPTQREVGSVDVGNGMRTAKDDIEPREKT